MLWLGTDRSLWRNTIKARTSSETLQTVGGQMEEGRSTNNPRKKGPVRWRNVACRKTKAAQCQEEQHPTVWLIPGQLAKQHSADEVGAVGSLVQAVSVIWWEKVSGWIAGLQETAKEGEISGDLDLNGSSAKTTLSMGSHHAYEICFYLFIFFAFLLLLED